MSWTVLHALSMLGFTALAWLVRDVRVVALGGAASLAALVSLRARQWTPAGRFGLANAVTAVRVALVVALSTFPGGGAAPALTLALVLALDGVDGWLARRGQTVSEFGAQFDMETDALTVLVAGLVLVVGRRLGGIVVVPGLLRYLYVLTLAVLPGARGEVPPSRFGKRAFVAYVLALVASLWPLEPYDRPVLVLCSGVLVASFVRSFYWTLRG